MDPNDELDDDWNKLNLDAEMEEAGTKPTEERRIPCPSCGVRALGPSKHPNMLFCDHCQQYQHAIADDAEERRHFEITLPKEHWARLDRLAEAHPYLETTADLISDLLDHAQQGVYRSGAWERSWLQQAVPYDAIEEAYLADEDPRFRDARTRGGRNA